jgi:hypothetical protein
VAFPATVCGTVRSASFIVRFISGSPGK